MGRRYLLPGQQFGESGCRDHGNTRQLGPLEQVPIAADNEVGRGLNGAVDDSVLVFDGGANQDRRRLDISHEHVHQGGAQAELGAHQDAPKFFEDTSRDCQRVLPLDGRGKEAVGRSAEEHGRNEDVRIERSNHERLSAR